MIKPKKRKQGGQQTASRVVNNDKNWLSVVDTRLLIREGVSKHMNPK